jgi:hypothetical protein
VNESEQNDVEALASYKNITEIISDLHKENNTDDGDYEEYWDKMHDMVLSVEEKKMYEICLGTGGPGYHLNVEVSGNGNEAHQFLNISHTFSSLQRSTPCHAFYPNTLHNLHHPYCSLYEDH